MRKFHDSNFYKDKKAKNRPACFTVKYFYAVGYVIVNY